MVWPSPDVVTLPAEGFTGRFCAAAPAGSASDAATAVERRSWNRMLDAETMVELSYSRILPHR
jgi:hypothetical protein